MDFRKNSPYDTQPFWLKQVNQALKVLAVDESMEQVKQVQMFQYDVGPVSLEAMEANTRQAMPLTLEILTTEFAAASVQQAFQGEYADPVKNVDTWLCYLNPCANAKTALGFKLDLISDSYKPC